MDNEMISRVAEAIELQGNPRAMAIAAFKAMREPTEKMVEAALRDYMYREKSNQSWNGKTMYRAMIDAITND